MSWVGVGVGAAGLIGSWWSSRQAAKAARPTQQQQEIERMMAENMRLGKPYAMDFLKGGAANLKIFNDFYRKLATGDRASALSLLAPQLRMADQQNAAALGSEIGLAPRSGGSGEARLAGMNALRGAREDSLLNLRTGAVDKLGALGGEMTSLGSGLLGQANNTGLGLYGAIQGQRNTAFDQSRQAGQSAFDIMRFLYGAYQNRSGSTRTTTPTPPSSTSQYSQNVWSQFGYR